MEVDKSPDLPLLSLSDQDFRKNMPESADLLAECQEYLNILRKQHCFEKITEKEIETRPYGIYDNDGHNIGGYQWITERSALPELRPEDMIARVSATATFGKFTSAERNSARNREVGKLRDAFAHQAQTLIRHSGKSPMNKDAAFTLDFFLRGAMKNYDPKKTLAMNAKQFEFDVEQKRLLSVQKAAQRTAAPRYDRPESY